MNSTIKKLNKLKIPIVKINHDLDKLEKQNLFPEKLKKANMLLKSVGLPKVAPQK